MYLKGVKQEVEPILIFLESNEEVLTRSPLSISSSVCIMKEPLRNDFVVEYDDNKDITDIDIVIKKLEGCNCVS